MSSEYSISRHRNDIVGAIAVVIFEERKRELERVEKLHAIPKQEARSLLDGR